MQVFLMHVGASSNAKIRRGAYVGLIPVGGGGIAFRGLGCAANPQEFLAHGVVHAIHLLHEFPDPVVKIEIKTKDKGLILRYDDSERRILSSFRSHSKPHDNGDGWDPLYHLATSNNVRFVFWIPDERPDIARYLKAEKTKAKGLAEQCPDCHKLGIVEDSQVSWRVPTLA